MRRSTAFGGEVSADAHQVALAGLVEMTEIIESLRTRGYEPVTCDLLIEIIDDAKEIARRNPLEFVSHCKAQSEYVRALLDELWAIGTEKVYRGKELEGLAGSVLGVQLDLSAFAPAKPDKTAPALELDLSAFAPAPPAQMTMTAAMKGESGK